MTLDELDHEIKTCTNSSRLRKIAQGLLRLVRFQMTSLKVVQLEAKVGLSHEFIEEAETVWPGDY
jgi:hypothetical protein